jgi:hypothetical protein
MTITTANCPSCGGPITFKIGSSVVVICEFCNSAVARTDRDLRNMGKVADLIDSRSPLRVGLTGRFDGRPFTLTGRVQIGHEAGGLWDEWYAAFEGGGWGWLAEAQGKFYMTFPRQIDDANTIPPYKVLQPGQQVSIPDTPAPFVVAEKGVGRLLGARGEIPYLVQPGATYAYADISGQGGAFGTIDYRYSTPAVFAGREVNLKEMGISTVVDEFDAEQKKVEVQRLICPNCNGPLELRAPDASQRVTCPSCNGLLDINKGNLSYLRALEEPRPQRFPIGAEAVFDGVTLTIVGFMVRGCQVEGEWYYWEEYLLYNPGLGFRWLVNGEGGWSFVETVTPGDVQRVSDGRVRYAGKSFSLKEAVTAVVAYVRGEFYWKVEVGEQVRASDFQSRQESLSLEESGGEINWSFGRKVSEDVLAKGFDPKSGKKNPVALPPPRVITPPTPLPSFWATVAIWVVLAGAAFLVWGVIYSIKGAQSVVAQTVSFPADPEQQRPAQPAPPDAESAVSWVPGQVEHTVVVGTFKLEGGEGLEFEVKTSGTIGGEFWLRLVNDVSGEVRTQQISPSDGTYHSNFEAPGEGTYTLYAIRRAPEGSTSMDANITVKTGATDTNLLCCFPVFLLIGPVGLLVAKAVRAMFSE